MQASFATTKATGTGLEDVYRSHIWRIARVTSPEMVLRYDPRLSDLGCLNRLEEAKFFARERILWIVERHGVVVATMRRSDDEYDAIFWREPELIEIAACQSAWQLLPTWLQTPIWRRLLGFIRGHVPVVHDRPEIRRLAERTFRARVDRAIEQGNVRLLEELAEDCPFLGMKRDELLQQQPCELRRWFRLLRLPKDIAASTWVSDLSRAMRHAAGLLDAMSDSEESTT
jgi:hypothetical protein